MAVAVQTRNSGGTSTSDTTSHSISMPSGINVGDLLVVVFSVDGNPTCSVGSGNWNKLGQASNSTVVTGAVFWKIAEGSDTCTVTTSASEQSTHVSLRISGAKFLFGTSANGSSTNSNPPNFDAYISKEYLWLATRSGDSTVVATAAPTNFSNLQTQTASGTSGASTNTAERITTASSQNPGTFTSNTEQWVSWTLAAVPDDGQVFAHSFSSSTTASVTTGSTVPITVPEGLSNSAIAVILTAYDPSDSDRTLSSLKLDSTTQSSVVSINGGPGGDGANLWGFLILNPSAGSHNLVTLFNGSVENHTLSWIYLGNVKQSGQPDNTNTQTIGVPDGTESISLTTNVNNCLVFSGGDLDVSSSPDSTQVTVSSILSGYINTSFSIKTTAGSVSHGYTGNTGEQWDMLIYSIAPVSTSSDLTISVSDSITVSESVGRLMTSFISKSESISVTDTPNVALAHQINVSDSISVTEAVNTALAHQIRVSDSIAISESISKNITGLSNGNLTTGSSAVDGTVYTTDSITPAADALLLLTIESRAAAVQPTIASVSGNGLTWVEIDHVDNDNSGSRRTIHLYRAMGASPSAGAVTITFNDTQTACTWTIDQITGADTSGTNGSGAIVQFADNVNRGPAQTSLAATLAAFSNVNNGTYAAFGTGSVGTSIVAGTDFSTISYIQETTESTASLFTEWKNVNDTSADVSFSADTENGIIAIEVKFLSTDINVSVSDSITVSESISTQLTIATSVSDSISVSESTNIALVHQINVSDAISISESLNIALAHQINVSDSITASESISNSLLIFPQVSDSISVSESVSVNADNSLSVNVSDSISVSESIKICEESLVRVSDSISVSESTNIALAHQIAVSDSISVAESTAISELIFISVSDNISVAESITPDLTISVQSPALIHYQPFGQAAIPPNWQEFGNGTWTYTGSILTQSAVGSGDPQKVLYTGDSSPLERVVQALVTFDTLNSGTDNRGGITIIANNTNARGYNLVLRGNNSLSFLNDLIAWGPSTSISPVQGESWWLKAMYLGGVLYGKAWKNGTTEPGWMITWTQTPDASFVYSGITGNSSSNTAKYSYDEFSYYGVPDGVTVSESVSVSRQQAATLSISVSDNISVAESVSVSEVSFVSVSDSISVGEAANVALAHQVNVSDSIGVSESVNVALTHQISISDSIGVAESVSVNEAIEIAVSDSISVAEAVEASRNLLVSVSDSITVSENISTTVSDPQINVSDAISVTDAPNVALVHQIAVSDNISVAESINKVLISDIAVSDSISVSENTNITLVSLPSVSDSILVSENVQVSLTLEISVSDSIGVAESTKVSPEFGISVSDAVSVAESTTVDLAIFARAAENISIAESVTMFTDKLYLSVSDTIAVSDQPNLAFVHFISVSDAISVSESVSLTEPHVVEYINKKLIFVDGRLAYLIVDAQGIPHYTFI